MFRKSLLIVLAVVFLSGAASLAQQQKLRVMLRQEYVNQYGRLEIGVAGVGDYERPGDPAQVKLDAVLQSPSGETIVAPGFAMHETREIKRDNQPKYVPAGPWRWRVRYMPNETGKYTGVVKVTDAEGVRTSEEFSFNVRPSRSKGILRIAENNPWAFEYEDGTPYIAIGQNLSWSHNDRLEEYRQWLDDMVANGCNFIRIWFGADWCFGIQGSEPYRYNEDAAELMDRVLKLCEARGVAIKFCFGDNVDGYLGKKGGPFKQCDSGLDFLTKESAKTQWKALQRYCIARYGASTSILAWELWNEMDDNFGNIHMPEVIAWTEEMCSYVKSVDPHGHMTTNSTGSGKKRFKLYGQPSVDFAQYHNYGGARYPDQTQYEIYDDEIRALRKLKRPVLLAECGLVNDHWGNYPATTPQGEGPKDEKGYAFHEALWIGFFGGGAGTGMHWWWDSMVQEWDYYPQFQPFADFVSDIHINEAPLPPTEGKVTPENLCCYVRQNDRRAVVWVINKNNDWRSLVEDEKEPETVSEAKLSLSGLKDGKYKVVFMNTWTGNTSNGIITAENGQASIVLPQFNIDTAVKLIYQGN